MRDQKEIDQTEQVFATLSPNARRVLLLIVELEKENLHLDTKQASRAVVDQMMRRIEGIG